MLAFHIFPFFTELLKYFKGLVFQSWKYRQSQNFWENQNVLSRLVHVGMSSFIYEFHDSRVIDDPTECLNVAGGLFWKRRQNSERTFVWQMEMPALCQPWVIPGVSHSHLTQIWDLELNFPELWLNSLSLVQFHTKPPEKSAPLSYGCKWVKTGFLKTRVYLKPNTSLKF